MKMAADGGGKLISTVKSLSGTFKDLQTGKKTVEELAASFGRTPGAVRQKIFALGLRILDHKKTKAKKAA